MKNWTWLLIPIVIFLWIAYPFILDQFFDKSDVKGQFGDAFGALNTLFSGLAFATIVVTIVLQQQQLKMQKEELELQRKELELTRTELKRSADAQEKSELALKDQIEKLELSAKLTALSSLLTTYHSLSLAESKRSVDDRVDYKRKVDSTLKELEKLKQEF